MFVSNGWGTEWSLKIDGLFSRSILASIHDSIKRAFYKAAFLMYSLVKPRTTYVYMLVGDEGRVFGVIYGTYMHIIN